MPLAVEATTLYLQATTAAGHKSDKQRLRQQFGIAADFAEKIKSCLGSTSTASKTQSDPTSSLKCSGPIFSDVKLSTKEQTLLLRSSKLNGTTFPPWSSADADNAGDGELFTDPGGFLPLSSSQKQFFSTWSRPTDILGNQFTLLGDGGSDLIQDVLSDCSVIASLCSAVAWEERSKKPLVSNIIYPQSISTSGRYVVRLFFNGVFRKVVIDDYLPVSNTVRRIHVVSKSNDRLLWPALVEKAYLKVMGGYDFPGSNAASDLFALTTWIPEHILLHIDPIDISTLWQRITVSWRYNDLLLTIGTGKLSREEELSVGLISEHDYAILDLKVLDDDTKVVLIKNPWSCGPSLDIQGSLRGLQDKLPASSGCFWMEFSQLCIRFNSLYLNWNPQLFRHKKQVHFDWNMHNGSAVNSLYLCPQFALENRNSTAANVWLLLSRHIRKRNDAKTYIGLYIFNDPGTRIWIRKSTVIKTKFVDSQQTLVKVEVPPKTSYTIVAGAQTDMLETNYFSLFVYCTLPVNLQSVTEGLATRTGISGQWTELSAGGNSLCTTFASNPQFKLVILKETTLQLFIETSATIPVLAHIVWGGGRRVQTVRKRDIALDTGEYSVGCALSKQARIMAGEYTVVVSLYEAGVMGDFHLEVMSDESCILSRLADLWIGHFENGF
ncbi:hypothetical protein V1525DRAFT_344412 [Lipomyces kononenkoae]|uniref:Uncharacterized protein n=1 Tax=Lipomyces kononenkoae TaxID=34357 RepID=A0ACC3T1E8_LIPKO